MKSCTKKTTVVNKTVERIKQEPYSAADTIWAAITFDQPTPTATPEDIISGFNFALDYLSLPYAEGLTRLFIDRMDLYEIAKSMSISHSYSYEIAHTGIFHLRSFLRCNIGCQGEGLVASLREAIPGTDICVLPIDRRYVLALKRAGISTFKQLSACDEKTLNSVRSLGRTGREQLKECRAMKDLRWAFNL